VLLLLRLLELLPLQVPGHLLEMVEITEARTVSIKLQRLPTYHSFWFFFFFMIKKI